MKRSRIILSLAMVLGTALAAWGLFAPLIVVPVVGNIRYVEVHLGGRAQADYIITLFALATLLAALPERAKRFASLFAGAALGLTIASCLAIYRSTVDQIEQMGNPDVTALLAQAKALPGFWFLAAGILIWSCGVIYTLFEERERRW